MKLQSLAGQLERDPPVCQVNCVNEEKVRRLKPQVESIEGVATIFKALADDTRVKIIYALSEAELCVCDIAALIGSSKATASYHLRLLHHMGLARYRKAGKLVYYRLADPHVGNLVREVLQHLARTQE
ncbi:MULTISPECIES: ArsR/SmtB family transcription factor [Neomoorella]|uniref:ArsR/SmtB family transcription factor n=1 Tax=Neomoorella TaxID=44260 RepID=UPI000920AE3F|nr:metalloregulator ArsR/SmtB family transcription factor [Moorella thermoacetica]OIQ10424.1 cadmium resistance transcriptional regulatory protein CadC [Moorella thermoacetica]